MTRMVVLGGYAPPFVPPGQGTGLRVTGVSSSSLNVSWSIPNAGTYPVASFVLYRSSSLQGVYTQVLATAGVSFNDSGLAASTTYYYRVSALDSRGFAGPISDPVGGTTTAIASIKFNPGHYGQGDLTMSTSPQTDGTFANMDRMAAADARFAGYCIQIAWSGLQTTLNGALVSAMVSAINAVRTRLQTNYAQPKRLIIKIRVETYGGPLPSFITSGISGLGTDAFSINSGSASAPALWRAAVMNAYINMLNQLGVLYDADPYVEALVALEETSLAYDVPPGDFSGAAFYTQLQALINALSSWPNTIKACYPNFGPTGTNQAWINTAITYASTKSGWAAGGPDLLVPATGESWGELQFHGGAGSDGLNYQGRMPCIIGIESDVYLWLAQTSAGDESYGFSTLHPTHMLWSVLPQSIYQPLGIGNASQWWETGTLPALQAQNFRIASSAQSRPANC